MHGRINYSDSRNRYRSTEIFSRKIDPVKTTDSCTKALVFIELMVWFGARRILGVNLKLSWQDQIFYFLILSSLNPFAGPRVMIWSLECSLTKSFRLSSSNYDILAMSWCISFMHFSYSSLLVDFILFSSISASFRIFASLRPKIWRDLGIKIYKIIHEYIDTTPFVYPYFGWYHYEKHFSLRIFDLRRLSV